MPKSFEQGILKYLALAAFAFSVGSADSVPSLLQVPADVLGDVVDNVDGDDWHSDDRRRVLRLLAHDPRPIVRARVAEKASVLSNDTLSEAESLLRLLAHDKSGIVRAASASGLGRLLQRASPLARVSLVGEWSTSEVDEERVAIASALCDTTLALAVDLAIEQLAADDNCLVRRFATEAAARHFEEDPDAYARVLTQLCSDPVRLIRRRARRALGKIGRV